MLPPADSSIAIGDLERLFDTKVDCRVAYTPGLSSCFVSPNSLRGKCDPAEPPRGKCGSERAVKKTDFLETAKSDSLRKAASAVLSHRPLNTQRPEYSVSVVLRLEL